MVDQYELVSLIYGLVGDGGSFFFQAEDGIRDLVRSRGLGDVYKRQAHGVGLLMDVFVPRGEKNGAAVIDVVSGAWYSDLSLIHI